MKNINYKTTFIYSFITLTVVFITIIFIEQLNTKKIEKQKETTKNYIKYVDNASTETITNALKDISKLDKKDLKESFDKKKKKKLEKYYNNTEDNLEKIMILEILEREYNENVEIERNKLINENIT